MKAIKNKVVVKADLTHKTEKQIGDTKLELQVHRNSRRLESNSQLATVVAIPERKTTGYRKEEFDMEMVPGDLVYVNWNQLQSNSVNKKTGLLDLVNDFKHNGEVLQRIDTRECFFVIRCGEIIPINDYVIIEPIRERITNTFLAVPESAQGKPNREKGIVRFVSKYAQEQAPELSDGVTAYFVDNNTRYQIWWEGKEYYRVRVSELVAIEK